MTEAMKRAFSVPIGTTVIIGSEYLSGAALDFIEIALSVYPNNVKSIYIDVNDVLKQKVGEERVSVSGWHDARTRSVELNLQEILRQAIDHTEPHEGASRYCALRTELWSRFCVILLHEIGHDYTFEIGGQEGYDAVNEKELTQWSIDVAMELGKTYNMEPARWEHEPYFGQLFQNELAAAADDKEKEDWLLFQMELLDSDLAYNDVDKGIELTTFHAYQQYMSVDPMSKDWKKETIDITPVEPEPEKPVVELPEKQSVIALRDKPIVTQPVVPVDAPANEAIIQVDAMEDDEWTAQIVEELSTAADEDFLPPSYQDVKNDSIQRQTVLLPNGAVTDAPPAQRKFPPTPIEDVQPLPPHITYDVWSQAVQNIFLRCGEHLFAAAAQWQPNNNVPFGNPNHCTSAFSIADIPHANEIVMFMDFTQGNGRPAKKQSVQNGVICGKLAKLPCVVLYLNRGGKLIKRTIQAVKSKYGQLKGANGQNKEML